MRSSLGPTRRASATQAGASDAAPGCSTARSRVRTGALRRARRGPNRRRRRRRAAPPPRRLGRRDPEADRDREIAGGAPRPPHRRAARSRGRLVAGARRAGARDDVEKARRQPRGGAPSARRATSARRGRPCRGRRARSVGRIASASSGGRSVTQHRRRSRPLALRAAARGDAAAEQRVEVREEDAARGASRARIRRADLEDARERRAGRERPRGRALEHGAVGDRVREGNAELEDVRARPLEGAGRARPSRRRRGRRRSGRRRRRPAPRAGRAANASRDARLTRGGPAQRARTPRDPCRRGPRGSRGSTRLRGIFGASFEANAMACALSSAGTIPSVARQRVERVERLGVRDLRVGRRGRASCEMRVLGADGRIVEAGRDGVGRQRSGPPRPGGASCACRAGRRPTRPRIAPRARPARARGRRPRRRRAASRVDARNAEKRPIAFEPPPDARDCGVADRAPRAGGTAPAPRGR